MSHLPNGDDFALKKKKEATEKRGNCSRVRRQWGSFKGNAPGRGVIEVGRRKRKENGGNIKKNIYPVL